MNGKIVGGGLLVIGAVAGIALYYLEVYAYYQPVSFVPGAEILLTTLQGQTPEAIVVDDLQGTEKTSSPLGFRACFTTPLSQAMLTETYTPYAKAEPTIAPPWFDCFDAAQIGAALEKGEALAFLSVADIAPQIDRVVAVFGDGRAYAWHQVKQGTAEGLN